MLAGVEYTTIVDCILFLSEGGNKKQEGHSYSQLSLSWVPGETGVGGKLHTLMWASPAPGMISSSLKTRLGAVWNSKSLTWEKEE